MATSSPDDIADAFIADRSPAAVENAMAALGAKPAPAGAAETGAWTLGAAAAGVRSFAARLGERIGAGTAGPVTKADGREIRFLATPESDPERAEAHHGQILEARSKNRDLAFETVLAVDGTRLGRARGQAFVDVASEPHPVLVVTYKHVPATLDGMRSRVASNAVLSVAGSTSDLAEGRYGIKAFQTGPDGASRPLRTTRADEGVAIHLARRDLGVSLLPLSDALEAADAELRRVAGRPAAAYPTRRAATLLYPKPADLARTAEAVRAKPPFSAKAVADLATTFHEAARLDCHSPDKRVVTLRGLAAIEHAAKTGAEIAMDKAMMDVVKARILRAKRQRTLAPDPLDAILNQAPTATLRVFISREELDDALRPQPVGTTGGALRKTIGAVRYAAPGERAQHGEAALKALADGFGKGRHRSIEIDVGTLRRQPGFDDPATRKGLVAALHASATRERGMRSRVRTPDPAARRPAPDGAGL